MREVLHLPGLAWNFHEHGTALLEFALWDRSTPEGSSVFDRSLNATLMGYF